MHRPALEKIKGFQSPLVQHRAGIIAGTFDPSLTPSSITPSQSKIPVSLFEIGAEGFETATP
jgi:hypothetical protein